MNATGHAAALGLLTALILGCCGCGTPAMSAAPPAMCNPFGDPPAIVTGTAQPDCLRGRMLGPWRDADGNDRYACLWEPHRAGSEVRWPLVIYLHPSLFGPQTVAKTDLLRYQDSTSLSADGTLGYIVLAPMGRRTLHHYPRPDEKGLGWDNWYRQLNPAGDATVLNVLYRPNADGAAIDHFVGEEVSAGKVDSDRIFVVGWSNGAAMAYLYGLNRAKIAAVAVYSAPDPFGALDDPCPQVPRATAAAGAAQIEIFNPAAPTMHVHNNCDIAGLCPNAERMAKQIKAAGVAVRDVIIDYTQTEVNQCTLSCGGAEMGAATPGADLLGYSVGFIEHSRWPKRWTPVMLDFLRSHPLRAGHSASDGGPQNEIHLAH
ncbi:MAG TPA: PHB depolymerase family esterase [Candidatus Binataceae bacterium]